MKAKAVACFLSREFSRFGIAGEGHTIVDGNEGSPSKDLRRFQQRLSELASFRTHQRDENSPVVRFELDFCLSSSENSQKDC